MGIEKTVKKVISSDETANIIKNKTLEEISQWRDKKLVEILEDALVESDSPEYPDEDLQSILLYGTAVRLSTKYDLYKTDLVIFQELRLQLMKAAKIVMDTQPVQTKYRGRNSNTRRTRYGEDTWEGTNR